MQETATRINIPKQYLKGFIVAAFLLIFFGWLLNTPQGILGKADAIGYAVCHRIDLRSFYIGDVQLPLCARCSGMYLGAMLGLGYQWIFGRKRVGMPTWEIILPTSIFVLLFAIDGLNSFISLFMNGSALYEPSNSLRLLTGTGMGLAIAVVLFPAFNATAWKMVDPRPVFIKFRIFLFLILIALLMDILILQENSLILYPLSIISAAGVLVLLMLVYSMVLLMIFKSENRFTQLNQLTYPFIAGLTLALIQIGLLDFIRYFITGTWDGFHI